MWYIWIICGIDRITDSQVTFWICLINISKCGAWMCTFHKYPQWISCSKWKWGKVYHTWNTSLCINPIKTQPIAKQDVKKMTQQRPLARHSNNMLGLGRGSPDTGKAMLRRRLAGQTLCSDSSPSPVFILRPTELEGTEPSSEEDIWETLVLPPSPS